MTISPTQQRTLCDEHTCEPMTIGAATAHQLVSAGSPNGRQLYDEHTCEPMRLSAEQGSAEAPVVQRRVIYDEHTSEPLKLRSDILRISTYLINNNRWRDNMLFIVGINVALRVSDLITLQFCDFFDADWNWRESFKLIEKKTRKKGKNRAITINAAVREAVELYLAHNPDVAWDDYLFRSESNNSSRNGHLNRRSVYDIITKVIADLNIPCKAGTHTLRKTFGYQLMAQADNDHKVDTLLLLQEILGHSDLRITRRYIGITTEDISGAYNSLNLGLHINEPSWNPVVVQGGGTFKTEPTGMAISQ